MMGVGGDRMCEGVSVTSACSCKRVKEQELYCLEESHRPMRRCLDKTLCISDDPAARNSVRNMEAELRSTMKRPMLIASKPIPLDNGQAFEV
jgi:hypothetical protein